MKIKPPQLSIFFPFINLRKFFIRFCLVVLLAALLIAVNYFGVKFNARWDLTALKQHTLSVSTVKILKNLDTDVQLTALYVGIPPNYIKDLLGEYERFSGGRLKSEIIDPLVDLSYAAQFGSTVSGEEKRVVVRAGKERRDIDFKDEPLSEGNLTNALLKVTRKNRTVYFVTGHDEFDTDSKDGTGYSILKNTLEEKNYTLKKLFLGSADSIPQNCDLLVIAGPKNPIPDKEEDVIQGFLKKGGKALFLIESAPRSTEEQPLSESEKQKNPTLNRILNPWGFELGDDVVVDLENHVGNDVGCPATRNYPHHKEIVRNLDYTFYIRPRSIAIVPSKPESVKIAPLVFTASPKSSWVETNKFLHVKFEEKEDTRGPVSIAAVAWEPKNEKKTADTKIVIFTDGEFATNNFIGQYSNADMILNSIQWLAEEENLLPFIQKNFSVKRLDLTSKQVHMTAIILFALPIVILGLGLFVWWRQKNYDASQ